jgi:hypothetical protein
VAAATFLILLTTPAAAGDLPDAELAGQAAAAFAEGIRLRDDAAHARPHFTRAAEGYEELRLRGVDNPALYRNLGRAYLLAGNLPRALLSYRQGLRRYPGDAGLRADLTAARERVVYPPYTSLGRPVPERRPPWWPHPSPGSLAGAAALSYALGWVGLTLWRMTRRGRLLTAGVAGLAVATGLVVWAVVAGREEEDAEVHPAVVVAADGVRLRRGDGPAYPPRYDTPLNRGVEARLLFQRDDWLQIEMADGEVGWVPRKAVLVDEVEK